MACRAFGCKQEAKFENGIGVRVCSAKCASKLAPDAHLIMAEHHHTLEHPSDPSLIHIHKTSPMIGIYRKEPSLILRKGKTSLDQCVSAERPDYFEVNKKVATALKTALVGISKEEIEQQLEEARREAQEVARKRQELQKQLDELKEEERKRKMGETQAKKSAKEAEKERKAEERRRQKEETRKRRNEKARKRRQEAKEKEAAKKAAAGGEEGARKKPTGKQLDELNDDVLLLMIAQLDDETVRSLAMVNRRFNNLSFKSLFEKSSKMGKMRFMYLAILNNKWDRIAFVFSSHEKLGFSMSGYFRKLLLWSSPWAKANSFAFVAEDMSDLNAWEEETPMDAQQVEAALDIFIRVAFFKESTTGDRQPMNTPKDLRYFVRSTMINTAVFHHLNILNRFFIDPLWSQTILIDPKLAKQEMMIQAANAGFAAFVAQTAADPTIDVTYKNSSAFGVVVGEAYRSPYDDSEYFLTSEAADGPTDISQELDQVFQVLMQSGRPFEKRNPDEHVQDPHLFIRWNQWWNSEADNKPEVIEEDQLSGPVTSKKNKSLAEAVFNVRKSVIDGILPLHTPAVLTDDIQLARMLIYYYPVAGEWGSYKVPSTALDLFDRVMQQSGNMLVPVGLGPNIIPAADFNLFEGAGYRRETLKEKDRGKVLAKLRDILLRDPRLSVAQRKEITDAAARAIAGETPEDDNDEFEDGDDDDDDDDEEDETKKKYPDPWVVYWQKQDGQASPMQL